jgi:HAD superfamily hydrolase (TIGR01509 family)
VKELVIFDCDGVLVDSEMLSLRALIECLQEQKIIKRHDQFDPAFFKGAKLAVILKAIEDEVGVKLPPDFENRYRQRMDSLFSTELRAIAGVSEALQKIPYAICVASSGPPEKIRRSLALAGLANKFEQHVFSSYTVQSWKSDPGVFLHAAAQMGAEPSNCIVVEDSLLGVIAAAKAGMRALAYIPDGNDAGFVAEGAMPFLTMADLPSRIELIFGKV